MDQASVGLNLSARAEALTLLGNVAEESATCAHNWITSSATSQRDMHTSNRHTKYLHVVDVLKHDQVASISQAGPRSMPRFICEHSRMECLALDTVHVLHCCCNQRRGSLCIICIYICSAPAYAAARQSSDSVQVLGLSVLGRGFTFGIKTFSGFIC